MAVPFKKSAHSLWVLVAIALIWAGLTGPAALAQGLGRITGVVTDTTGAVVPNAHVVATRVGTNEQTTVVSNSDGSYVFPSLPPAEYTISVSEAGFSSYLQKGVVLQADQAATVNIALQVGSTTQTVNVSAAPPQVDTTTGTLSQVVTQKSVNDLPLDGRNAASLTELVAGVVAAPDAQTDQGTTKSFPVVVTISANGTLANQTDYLLDGANNVDEYTNVNDPFPFPDALQEFSVQTSNYNAQYGQNAGGVVNIITRSGTNQYHGDAFEYLRNGVFNAANYFSYANGVKVVDPLKRNQFGGTFGGPVAIPHLFSGHKAFFFVGYQRETYHDVSSATTASTLPSTSELAGNFTGCMPSYPCTNGTTYINPASFNASSLALLKYLPPANASGSYTYRKPTNETYNEGMGRYDQDLGSNDHATARYYYDRFQLQGVLDPSNLLTYSDQALISYNNALVAERHTFNDHLLNEFTANYQLEDSTRGPVASSVDVGDLGVNIWQPAIKQINEIQVNGGAPAGFTVGDNPQAEFGRANYSVNDDVHYVIGSHNIGFGFHAEISKIDIENDYEQPGQFFFTSNGTGNGIASFLLGDLTTFNQASGQFFNNRGHFYGFYAQDSWKMNRRLTLDYGVRYEPFFPWHEIQNRMGGFSPAAFDASQHSAVYPNAPIGLLFAGDAGFNPEGVDTNFNHIMPRVGFAYDASGDGRTAIRGGFGMFYETRLSGVFNNIFSNNSPFVTAVGINYPNNAPGNFSNPYAGITNPFPAPQPPPSTAPISPQPYISFDPYNGFHVPVNYNWNLTLEQQLTGNLSMRLAYVGSHGSHEWEDTDVNSVYISGPKQGQRVYQYTPSGVASGLTQQMAFVNTGGNVSYHSLQASLTKQLSHGLSFLLNYTWSKSLSDLPYNASATAGLTGQSYVFPTYMPNYKRLDYGPTEFDHRNVISLSYEWALPKLQSGAAALRYVVNNWQTQGIYSFRSGDPLTVLSGSNNNSGSYQDRDRAVYLGTGAYGGNACGSGTPCKNWLNPAAFTTNPAGTFGNTQKGEFIGPNYSDWDVGLIRTFPLYERLNLQFRAEYFNVLNRTNLGDPNTTDTSSFGRITGTAPQNSDVTNDPRIAQFSLKLLF
ncbi:TonB-dependent receptor [Paracidobacterium acidisoli]|uniref:TonB-dependent receptor n=1 Tax=Paracidobacterium acidisoli TaxID=2303751 RepID=A0A372IJT5_9BACT|nr:TonB-dependent receptor [Paracidobacterium acidisoli]MBT9333070.1 TonB-dependent receptor [Paracidobacterium acidisoli]